MDDLITRLRALMAEIEHKLGHTDGDITPRLKEALRLPTVGADVGTEGKPQQDNPAPLKTYSDSMADVRSATPARQVKLDDYVPSTRIKSGHDPLHDEGFDVDDFIGCGDRDPLGHDAMTRGGR